VTLQSEVRRFVDLLKGLNILEDWQPCAETMSNILPWARVYNLSPYDAAYLDVAVRHGAPLATFDATLQNAGRAAGIKVFRV
jgi:predicted nucleic acid-binding protein